MQNPLVFEYRELLIPIAINLLKDPQEAEDMVQDTILAWLSKDLRHIENIKGYLVRALINRCLNRLRAQKREQKIDIAPELLVEYLPSLIENHDRISHTLLLMMERLTPMERAVFLLKEIFGYSHKEIAEILGISEAYSRQILARAKRHLSVQKQRFEVSSDQHLKLYESFVEVCKGNSLHQLIEILKEDVELYINRGSDPIQGCLQVGEYLAFHTGLFSKSYAYLWEGRSSGLKLIPADPSQPIVYIRLEWDDDSVSKIYWESETNPVRKMDSTEISFQAP